MNSMLIVSDYIFYSYQNEYYSEVPWNKEQFREYKNYVEVFNIIGRVRELTAPRNNLHKVEDNIRIVPIFDFRHPIEILYPWNLFAGLKTIASAIRKNTFILLKLFYFYSILAFVLNKLIYKKPIVSLLVGDAAEASLLRTDYIQSNQIRKLVSHLVYGTIILIQNGVDLAGYVAGFLQKKYKPKHNKVVVANESRLADWMYFKGEKKFAEISPQILFVGRLIKRKGVDLLVDNLIELINQGYKINATIVGDGPLRGELKERVRRNRLEDKIVFTGWLASSSIDLIKQYRNANIFILPSYAEGLPLVVLEAMANKCAVIATKVSGIPEVVIHERTGLLIKPGSKQELKKAILRYINDPSLAKRCAENGYQLSLDHSFEIQRGKFAAAVLNLVSSNLKEA